jgi:hypothetical protein
VITDKSGNILYYSNSFSAKLNKPEEDLTKFNYFKLLPEEVALHRKMFFDKVVDTGFSLTFKDVCFEKTWENDFSFIPGSTSKCPPKVILFSKEVAEARITEKKHTD